MTPERERGRKREKWEKREGREAGKEKWPRTEL